MAQLTAKRFDFTYQALDEEHFTVTSRAKYQQGQLITSSCIPMKPITVRRHEIFFMEPNALASSSRLTWSAMMWSTCLQLPPRLLLTL
jgi:hypothetical protein